MAKALITGAGGFIGSHVVETFLAEGYEVRALVRYTSTGRRGHLDRSPVALQAEKEGRLEIVLGDVTDPHLIDSILDGQDIVAHLAALIGIPYSYVAPASYQAVNVGGALHILEAARRRGTKRVIIASTSEVYGTAQYTPIDESHPLQAQSPYSASKIAADKLAESYHRSFGLPVVILRPFNTYGPRQSQRAIVPTVLVQALSGAPHVYVGNLAPKRDLTFVQDTAKAFALAAKAEGIEGQTIHFGSGVAFTVEEIARKCLAAANSTASLIEDPQRVRPEKSEVGCLVCDPAKARSRLGWRAEIDLDQGIEKTAQYIRAFLDDYRSGIYAL